MNCPGNTKAALLAGLLLATSATAALPQAFLKLPFRKNGVIDIDSGWCYDEDMKWDSGNCYPRDSDPFQGGGTCPPNRCHRAIDFGDGTHFPVLAAAGGWAIQSSGSDYGTFVLMAHDRFYRGQRLFTLYAHLESEVVEQRPLPRNSVDYGRIWSVIAATSFATPGSDARAWEWFGPGEKIGTASNSGVEDGGKHLHFELHAGWQVEKLDPYDLYGPPEIYRLEGVCGVDGFFLNCDGAIGSPDSVHLETLTKHLGGPGDGRLGAASAGANILGEREWWFEVSGSYSVGEMIRRGGVDVTLFGLGESDVAGLNTLGYYFGPGAAAGEPCHSYWPILSRSSLRTTPAERVVNGAPGRTWTLEVESLQWSADLIIDAYPECRLTEEDIELRVLRASEVDHPSERPLRAVDAIELRFVGP